MRRNDREGSLAAFSLHLLWVFLPLTRPVAATKSYSCSCFSVEQLGEQEQDPEVEPLQHPRAAPDYQSRVTPRHWSDGRTRFR